MSPDTESYGKRKSDDSDDNAGNQIRREGLAIVFTLLEQPEKFGLEHFFQVKFHTTL